MLSLKDEADIYRIRLVTGLFAKNDVVSWADRIISIQENVEYEIIEVPLLGSTSKTDIASKLFQIKGIPNI